MAEKVNAVQTPVGRMLLRRLSGFKGYPRGDGEGRFIEVLCEISLSVEHAEATVKAFDGDFPTIREMRDTAFGMRPQFQPAVDQRKQWEAECGKPDPKWSRRFTANYADERDAMIWQSIRDSIYYTEGPGAVRGPSGFWADSMRDLNRNHAADVAAFRVELLESSWPALMERDWAKTGPIKKAAPRARSVPVLDIPITSEDIQRELIKAGREPGDGE